MADEQDAGQKGTDDGSSAQEKDLDSILSQYDQEFDQDTKPPEQKPDDQVKYLQEQITHLSQKEVNADIDKAASDISEMLDAPVKPSRRIIKGFLNESAAEDPRIARAFQNRHRDPSSWSKILKGVAGNIEKEFDTVDQDLTESKNALTAAVQGKSQTSKSDDDDQKFMDRFFKACTDRQFEEYKRTGKVPASFK